MKLAGAYINDETYGRLVALAAANNRTLAGECRHLFDRALSGDLKVPRLPRAPLPAPAAGAQAQAVAKPEPQAAATPGAETPAGALPGVPRAAQPGVPCGAPCCGRLSTHSMTPMPPPAPAACRPPGVPPVCRAPALRAPAPPSVCAFPSPPAERDRPDPSGTRTAQRARLPHRPARTSIPQTRALWGDQDDPPPALRASAMPQAAVSWHDATPCPAAAAEALTCPAATEAGGGTTAMPRAATMQHAVSFPLSETPNAEGRAAR
ncbi:hypothetical protein [Prosthecobacter fluviatilis]|uniref:Uncharacterized protein n=1 Tax=Prosthecobacter fluviatilis TaxID=445931 RepID=A0ABW0KV45_9BACT